MVKVDEDAAWKEGDDGHIPWREQTNSQRLRTVWIGSVKTILLLICLYLFICSLVLMASALNVLAGRVAVDIFTSNLFLSNPVTGLIIGMLVTVVIQSSSTSTSIVIAMVASGVITVDKSIPIVMGANIGTSVTNTGVALTLSGDRQIFKRAFAGATVHDCFNLLSVVVLLPLEAATGYLNAFSGALVRSFGTLEGTAAPKFLKLLTKPVVGHLISVNKTVQKKSAEGVYLEPGNSLITIWCKRVKTTLNYQENVTVTAAPPMGDMTTAAMNVTYELVNKTKSIYVGIRKCEKSDFVFAQTDLSESAVGGILFLVSLVVLIVCLLGMVKILTSSLKGTLKRVIRKAVNTNFPKPFGWLSSYVAVFIGAGVTMFIQSSSVVTSTLTPLVGLDVVKLKRMYAVTVGANMGTTTTAVLAALATGSTNSLQIAFCHLLFNVSGFLLWYIIPFMRQVPLKASIGLGNITGKYLWFPVFYVIVVFFIAPVAILGLSFAPVWLLATVIILLAIIVVFVMVVNTLQTKRPSVLPAKLRNWDFLPLFMHSYKPLDSLVRKLCGCCKCCQDRNYDDQEIVGRENPTYENDMSAV